MTETEYYQAETETNLCSQLSTRLGWKKLVLYLIHLSIIQYNHFFLSFTHQNYGHLLISLSKSHPQGIRRWIWLALLFISMIHYVTASVFIILCLGLYDLASLSSDQKLLSSK